jgi:F-type H+-transporting ATPase subunit b
MYFPWGFKPPPDITEFQWAVVLTAGFILFALVYAKIIGPILRSLLKERQEAIIETYDQVETTLRETEQMRNDYRQRLEHIEDETEARMADAVREAETLREQILEEARHNAALLIQRGQEEVERERAKALVHLRTEFIDDVIRAAEFAVEKSLEPAQQRRMVQEFVQKVGTQS